VNNGELSHVPSTVSTSKKQQQQQKGEHMKTRNIKTRNIKVLTSLLLLLLAMLPHAAQARTLSLNSFFDAEQIDWYNGTNYGARVVMKINAPPFPVGRAVLLKRRSKRCLT
jgi:hypothetical protein